MVLVHHDLNSSPLVFVRKNNCALWLIHGGGQTGQFQTLLSIAVSWEKYHDFPACHGQSDDIWIQNFKNQDNGANEPLWLSHISLGYTIYSQGPN